MGLNFLTPLLVFLLHLRKHVVHLVQQIDKNIHFPPQHGFAFSSIFEAYQGVQKVNSNSFRLVNEKGKQYLKILFNNVTANI